MSSGLLLDTVKSCRDNLCVIDDQAVSRLKVIDNVIKMFMFNVSGIFVHHQES